MKKTVTLDSKIKQYASVACGITAVTSASAQVVYTDVNPDATITAGGATSQYAVDFDNDGSFDVAFAMFTGSQTGTYPYSGYNIPYTLDYTVGVATFGTAAPATNGWLASSGNVAGLSAGSRIGSSATFNGSQGSMGGVFNTYLGAPISNSFGPYSSGNFLGAEKYLGVRFDINGAVHYGWVRVEMSADATTMIIKDYAYESTPETPINAGSQASMVSVDELASQVTVRNINNNLNIKLEGINNADLTVVGLDGKQYINQVVGSVDVVSLGDLSTGIYLVNISTEEGLTTTQKIYVK
ncbi:MAG: T9SS type A sorting domain-containing protein [Flavobacteriales bacterium]|nr:T9SS type A sorting domain-containing protein [Flavobacteriales bacterium]